MVPLRARDGNPIMTEDITNWTVRIGRVKGRWDKTLLRVQTFTENRSHFAVGKQLVAVKEGCRELLTVGSSRSKDGGVILDCGLQNPEAADAWVGAELAIHPSMRPELPVGQYYMDQLLGFKVVTQTGEDLGEVEQILETPANLVFETPLAMVPDHPDFVVEIQAEERTITVRDVDGLRI